ncbi:MAG: flavodoxin family protein [Nitrospirae bacterium]|nr:flavodoxin family protein [Nitrospirota bacterium]
MKVIAFNGSARINGNTADLINVVFDELAKYGIETELFQLAGKEIKGCKACFGCFNNQDKRCVQNNDGLNECIAKMIEADGIILASPTYFGNVSSELKALIDRAGLVSKANGNLFKRKVGAGIAAVRRAGSIEVLHAINNFFFLSEMIIPCSSYWNIGYGREKGQALNDEEGVRTMRILGENMAWLMGKLNTV